MSSNTLRGIGQEGDGDGDGDGAILAAERLKRERQPGLSAFVRGLRLKR